ATFIIANGTPILLVGGGNATFYALNAQTGKILWSHRLGTSPSHFIWSSPVVNNGHVYVGLSSFGDCPLVPGQLFDLDQNHGTVNHIFNVVPNGCLGGGLW